MSNINKTILLIIVMLVGFSGLYYKKQLNIKHEKLLIEQQRIAQENKEKTRTEINSLFDNYLNDFKEELHSKAKLYKKSRRVLKDLISPYNFETPQYTKENYFLFKDNIAPNLRAQASEIIGVFQKYTDMINKNLQNQNNEIQQFFLIKWQEMSHEQLNNYVDFFAKEDELIQNYDALITFYYVHSNLFSVDIKSNKFTFSREEDQAKETMLREKINH